MDYSTFDERLSEADFASDSPAGLVPRDGVASIRGTRLHGGSDGGNAGAAAVPRAARSRPTGSSEASLAPSPSVLWGRCGSLGLAGEGAWFCSGRGDTSRRARSRGGAVRALR